MIPSFIKPNYRIVFENLPVIIRDYICNIYRVVSILLNKWNQWENKRFVNNCFLFLVICILTAGLLTINGK